MLLLDLLAGLKKPNTEAPGGSGGACGPGDGKGPSAAPKPRAPTAIETQQVLYDKIRSIDERATELQHDVPTTAEYLTNVVRLHCVIPACSVFYSAILTMFRCHGRPQVALESRIGGLMADVDSGKQAEFRALVSSLYGRAPSRQKPVVPVPGGTSASFDKLLGNLASADFASNVPKDDAPHILPEIEAFVLGAITVLRTQAASLQKNMNKKAYDFTATAACHLLNGTEPLLVENIPDAARFSRMVKYVGEAYYLTRWCVGKVRRCCFWRSCVVGFRVS